MRWSRFLFGLEGRASPLAYGVAGFGLATLKFLAEDLAAYVSRGVLLSPLAYLNPSIQARYGNAFSDDQWVWLLAWTLPFLWAGFVLTLRRAEDAGLSPWWSLFFFIPIVNLVLFAVLCFAGTQRAPVSGRKGAFETWSLRGAALGALIAMVIGISMVLFASITVQYGAALFVATPFVMGLIAGYLTNQAEERSSGATLIASLLALFLTGGALLLVAAEGVVCLAMASPIAMVLSAMGAMAGRSIARRRLIPRRAMGVLAIPVPLLIGLGAPTAEFRDVESVVEINASPDRVWPLVAAFPEIKSTPDFMFRAGIAMPVRATIDGSGVGALRRCVFTTGVFLEPITVWEPPTRLAFSVASQPRALTELTPYETLWAPHLDGLTLRVSEGEFRLIALPGGRTRVVGRTRYSLDMAPEAYWRAWGDAIIHRIHMRVLDHIKALAENPA